MEVEKFPTNFPPFCAKLLDIVEKLDAVVQGSLFLGSFLKRLYHNLQNFDFLKY